MSHRVGGRSVGKEDILTSRGANPRTGVISPFLLDGVHKDNDGGDYIHVRMVQDESESVRSAQSHWMQDELGWRRDELNYKRHLERATPHRETIVDHARARTRTLRDTGKNVAEKRLNTSFRFGASRQMQPHTSSECLFQIPRKPVGGQRASSTPDPKENRGAAQVYGHLKRMSGLGKKTQRGPSLACLDAENTAFELHTHPSVSLTRQSGKRDRVLSLSKLKPSGNDKGLTIDHKHRRICSLADYYFTSLSNRTGPTVSNLGKAYRRPKALLPAHLREASPPPQDIPPRIANAVQTATGASYHNPARVVTEQRPHIKRTLATATSQRIDANDNRGLRHISQDQEAIGHHRITEDMIPKRHQTFHQSSESRYVSRPAFLDVPGHKPKKSEIKIQGKPQHEATFGQTSPLLSLNGVLLAGQGNIVHDPCRELYHGLRNTVHSNSSPTVVGNDPLHRSNSKRTNGCCISAKTSGATPIPVQTLALEVLSLMDFQQVQGHFLNTVRHGLLAMGRSPGAIRTLRSWDAIAVDRLSAARCVLVASCYLIGLLSVFAAGMRTLELLLAIGYFCWYPLSVLLSLASWIMNP
ncbi:MAG: hypothetical protein Q9182_006557 [Xanthomendoza sp. 2 TL-2023]